MAISETVPIPEREILAEIWEMLQYLIPPDDIEEIQINEASPVTAKVLKAAPGEGREICIWMEDLNIRTATTVVTLLTDSDTLYGAGQEFAPLGGKAIAVEPKNTRICLRSLGENKALKMTTTSGGVFGAIGVFTRAVE